MKYIVNFLALFLFLTVPIQQTFANICATISGKWTGQWEDHQHKMFDAQLSLTQSTPSQFQGGFELSDGSVGTLYGKCRSLTENEAYLTLREEAPWYNPCRGTLLKVDKDIMIHFYCFKPNQSGYFVKSINSLF